MKPTTIISSEKAVKKLKMVSDLFHFVFSMKRFQLQKKYPALSEREITRLTAEVMEKGKQRCG